MQLYTKQEIASLLLERTLTAAAYGIAVGIMIGGTVAMVTLKHQTAQHIDNLKVAKEQYEYKKKNYEPKSNIPKEVL